MIRRSKRRRLVQGDKTLMFTEAKARAPVRIDRSMPSTYEEYVEQREERERLAARHRHFATAVASDAASPQAVAGAGAGANDDGVDDDGAVGDIAVLTSATDEVEQEPQS